MEEEIIEIKTSYKEGDEVEFDGYIFIVQKVLLASKSRAIYEVMLKEREEERILLYEYIDEERIAKSSIQLEFIKEINLPILPQILFYGEKNDKKYLCLSFKKGKSLEEAIKEGIDIFSFLDIIQTLCQFIQRCHLKKWAIISLTPKDIILTEDKGIQIINFDFVQRLDELVERPIFIEGFVDPELIAEQRASIKSDLYLLGSIMYYYLKKSPLPIGKEYEVVLSITNPRFSQIISRLVAPEPFRFETANEVFQELLNFKKEIKTYVNLVIDSATTIGVNPSRTVNEDSLGYWQKISVFNSKPELSFVGVVADGMGGHAKGEVASKIAVQEVIKYFQNKLDEIDATPTQSTMNNMVLESILSANRKVYEYSQNSDMGTTIAVVFIHAERMALGYVGDTRCYILKSNEVKLLTKDHSLAQILVDSAQLSQEEARKHSSRNKLIKSLGAAKEIGYDYPTTLKSLLQKETIELEDGDVVLLCSDGIWGCIEDEKIKEFLLMENPARVLVEESISRKTDDNATAVVIKVEKKRFYEYLP